VTFSSPRHGTKTKVRLTFTSPVRCAGAHATSAETFADWYTALLEGALILRQTHGRNDAARAVRPAIQQLIATYLPAAPGRPT
jgi:hypothetical protein